MHDQPLTGLSSEEARARLERYGPNTLGRPPRARWGVVLLRQFTGLLVLILIAAAVIAAGLGEIIDAIAIALVVLVNAGLGFIQEWKAENALAALGAMLSPKARVLRDGRECEIDSALLVPGDVVRLAAGDKVPADLALHEAVELRVDESALTGESLPVSRRAGPQEPPLFMGTAVVSGHGEGVVAATGRATAFGQIAQLTAEAEEKQTHLAEVLTRLARQMAFAALALAAIVAVAGLISGHGAMEMFMLALSLAVAIVPEGLPAVVTITLALGAAAMVRQNALARRLQAVETLGAASVICTDKTGTITEDKMTATRIWTPSGGYGVTGGGTDPAGHIETDAGRKVRAAEDAGLAALLETALLCNHARIEQRDGAWVSHGSPTEAALVTLAYKGWSPLPDPARVVAEAPFTSERKRMAVVVAEEGGGWALHVKGAPERVLERCDSYLAGGTTRPLGPEARARFEAALNAMAGEGMRVIALARAPLPGPELPPDETGLTFLGLIGLMDPPRPEVKGAIAAARGAGVRVIMITGDSPVTARAVAERVGLPVQTVLTGADLETLCDADLDAALDTDVLFARTAPAHKMRLVRALQAKGQIVAMTGDGVNDAPALKQSDIGVAMGMRGTDVARDAADLVLLDDNFATIVRAIREGRRQFENVRKFVRYLLSSNAGEVVALSVNILTGGPLILLATQILWINLVTDGINAVALGLEKATPGTMTRPPRDKNESVIGKAGFALILAFGLYLGGASLWLFHHLLTMDSETLARSAAFTAMVVFEAVAVFAFRSFHNSNTRIGWFSNPLLVGSFVAMIALQIAAVYWPPLQTLLHTAPLGWTEWKLIALLAAPLLVVPEAVKMLRQQPLPR